MERVPARCVDMSGLAVVVVPHFLRTLLSCFLAERRLTLLPPAHSPQDPNWYKARNPVGGEGTIPANYVQKREGVKSGGKLSLMP